MSEGKFRKRKVNFSQVSNKALQDKNLSLKAKGLFSMITSYISIPDFTLYKSFLVNSCQEGKTAFDSAWNELKSSGYLMQYRIQTGHGHFAYEYEIVDDPNSQKENNDPSNYVDSTAYRFSGTGETVSGKAEHGKQGCINNNNEINTNKNNIIINNNDDVVDWINEDIDSNNFTEKELFEFASKKTKDNITLNLFPDKNTKYFLKGWAKERLRNDVIYKYDLPKDEYLNDTPPTDRAERTLLKLLTNKRYKLVDFKSLPSNKLNELFVAALKIYDGEGEAISKTPEAYLIGVIDNMIGEALNGWDWDRESPRTNW